LWIEGIEEVVNEEHEHDAVTDGNDFFGLQESDPKQSV